MSDTPQIINHETPQKTNDVERMERVLRLKDLKEVTEKNLNLVRKAKRDQRLAIFFSVTVIIIGIVFITYESVNKDSTAFKIVANSLSGILSGSIIFSSIKGIFEINEKSKIIDKINIGPSVVDIEKGDIWAHDKKETLDDVKNIIKIVRERNENLNRMRIACFILNTICSLILIALILLNVFFSFILSKRTNRTDDYIYTISVLLITGGMYNIFRSMLLLLLLIEPSVLQNYSLINYLFVIHLFLTFLIRMKNNGRNNKNGINNNNERNNNNENGEEYDKIDGEKCTKKCKFEDDISFDFFCVKFFILRVNLVFHERGMIVRLLHGLSLYDDHDDHTKQIFFKEWVKSFFIYTGENQITDSQI